MNTPRIVGYWENWAFKGSNWKDNSSAGWNVMAQENGDTLVGCTDTVFSFITLTNGTDAVNPLETKWDGTNLYINNQPLFDSDGSIVSDWVNGGGNEQYNAITIMLQILLAAKNAGQRTVISVGGWSDLQLTPKFTETSSDKMVQLLTTLATYTSSDINLDWEHLGSMYSLADGTVPNSDEDTVNKCMYLGQVLSGINTKGVNVSYTTRSNAFVPYLGGKGSDCEAVAVLLGSSWNGTTDKTVYFNTVLSEFKKARSATVGGSYTIPSTPLPCEYISMMTYDGAVGSIASDGQYTYNDMVQVLDNNSKVSGIPLSKLMIGFEPDSQTGGGKPMTDDQRDQVITYIKKNNVGGFILWAMNDQAPFLNPTGPTDFQPTWKKSEACMKIAQAAYKEYFGNDPPVVTVPLTLYGCGWDGKSACASTTKYNLKSKPYFTSDCSGECGVTVKKYLCNKSSLKCEESTSSDAQDKASCTSGCVNPSGCLWYQTKDDQNKCIDPLCIPVVSHGLSYSSQSSKTTISYIIICIAILTALGAVCVFIGKIENKTKIIIYVSLGVVFIISIGALFIPIKKPNPLSPHSYSWNTGEWNNCQTGTKQTRSVTCNDETMKIVSNDNCSSHPPISSRDCAAYNWKPSSWTPSEPCTGNQTRTISCIDQNGNIVDQKLCTGSPGDTTQQCPTIPCNSGQIKMKNPSGSYECVPCTGPVQGYVCNTTSGKCETGSGIISEDTCNKTCSKPVQGYVCNTNSGMCNIGSGTVSKSDCQSICKCGTSICTSAQVCVNGVCTTSTKKMLPDFVRGCYITLADNNANIPAGTSSIGNWTPVFGDWVKDYNVLFFAFINPKDMEVPPSYTNAVSNRDQFAPDTIIMFSFGGQAYSTGDYTTWDWLQTVDKSKAMAAQVAKWNCDGVDSDIETPAGSGPAVQNLIVFFQELKRLNPNFILTQAAFGSPDQVPAATAIIESSWPNKTYPSSDVQQVPGLLDAMGIMWYVNSDSLQFISRYDGSSCTQWYCPSHSSVPKNNIIAGLGGDASSEDIQTICASGVRGYMVWYAPADNGFIYSSTNTRPKDSKTNWKCADEGFI